nr:immunoglobulin light chain junction region [Macaca mulatta]MOV80024.1 immunoglobulin light chain junction region [Macaca mulatta]
CQQVHTNPFTF